MKKKLVIVMVIALATVSGVWGGGQAARTAPNAGAVDRSNFNALGTFPLVKQKETITVMWHSSSPEFNAETNWFTQWYENKTNVHVNWIMNPSEQFKEKLNLAFAAGDQIDFVMTGGASASTYSLTDILKFAQQQVIMPIQNYIDSDTVNMKKGLTERAGLREHFTLPNGNIYVPPAFSDTYHTQWYAKMWINKEFLKNLGLSYPTTTDEFRTMLLAFKNRDANGNGDPNDEIPMAGAIDNFGSKVSTFLMSAFIYDDGENRLFLDNGKVTAAFTRPEFQEGLRYLNQLYRDGLIYPDSFVQSRSTRAQLNSQKYESVIGAIPNIHHGNLGVRESYQETGQPVRWIDYEPIAPVKGPQGLQITRYDYYPNNENNCGFIPVTAKNPALVMRWLDDFYTDENFIASYYGQEGVAVTAADPGATGENGSPARIQTIDLPRGHQYYGNMSWGNGPPRYMTADMRAYVQRPEDMLAPDGQGVERFLYTKTRENYAPYGAPISMLVPPLYYSEEDVSVIATLTTNINTYVEESMAKFINGSLNVNTDWNRFQSELKNLGIDQYLQIIQKTYDASAYAKR
jgi:putative aldouronate transport system substrate-binding protein